MTIAAESQPLAVLRPVYYIRRAGAGSQSRWCRAHRPDRAATEERTREETADRPGGGHRIARHSACDRTGQFGPKREQYADVPGFQGEDAAAPDITTVIVSNDDAGTISFQINIADRPALTPDMLIDILVDSDNNPATGEPNSGADYAIELVAGAVDLFRWNGSDFVSGAPQSSLIFSYTPAGPVIRVSALELGKTKAFAFSIDAASGIAVDARGNPDFTNVHDDLAPDRGHGAYAYQVMTKLILKVVAFTTSPTPARASKPFYNRHGCRPRTTPTVP